MRTRIVAAVKESYCHVKVDMHPDGCAQRLATFATSSYLVSRPRDGQVRLYAKHETSKGKTKRLVKATRAHIEARKHKNREKVEGDFEPAIDQR